MIDFINAQRKLQQKFEEDKSFKEPKGCNETKKGMARLCELIKNGANTTDELATLSGYSKCSIFANVRGLKRRGIIDTVKYGIGGKNLIVWVGDKKGKDLIRSYMGPEKKSKEAMKVILDNIKEFGFATRKALLDDGFAEGVVYYAVKKLKKDGVIYSKRLSVHRGSGVEAVHYLLKECLYESL